MEVKITKEWLKFITNKIFLFFVIGIILITIGQTAALYSIFPYWFSPTNIVHTVIKSIGMTLLGSGVFTVILKSSEYSDVFSKIIGEIIWSKKFIEKRSDKKEMWSMISKIIYEEKFPLISDEIEDIITSKYFPTTHEYYIDDYQITINIEENSECPEFFRHTETVTFNLRPTTSKVRISYPLKTSIDLPNNHNIEDVTKCVIEEVKINGESIKNIIIEENKDEKYYYHNMKVELINSENYHFSIKRYKNICKKTNPDKNFQAKSIIKGIKLTVICQTGINIGFYSSGTVDKFKVLEPQLNNGITVSSWQHTGLILPHQGFILIFK